MNMYHESKLNCVQNKNFFIQLSNLLHLFFQHIKVEYISVKNRKAYIKKVCHNCV